MKLRIRVSANLRKFAGFQEVQQTEKFFQIVLEWSSSEQQLVLDFVFTQRAKKLQYNKENSQQHFHFSSINHTAYFTNTPLIVDIIVVQNSSD